MFAILMLNVQFLKGSEMIKPKVVFLTGAGISKESGLATFRDCADGLWNNFKIEDVATPQGWHRDSEKVLEFYNLRRAEAKAAQPNEAHYLVASLQDKFDVKVITQNVDDLHERGGAKEVYHMHGSLFKVKEDLMGSDKSWDWSGDLHLGDCSEHGVQLRPDVVWFGENIKYGDELFDIAKQADVFVIVGTSLEVYPANTLSGATKNECVRIYVDPHAKNSTFDDFILIQDVATSGMKTLVDILNKTEFTNE